MHARIHARRVERRAYDAVHAAYPNFQHPSYPELSQVVTVFTPDTPRRDTRSPRNSFHVSGLVLVRGEAACVAEARNVTASDVCKMNLDIVSCTRLSEVHVWSSGRWGRYLLNPVENIEPLWLIN